MFTKKHTISFTNTASTYTAYSASQINGVILAVQYVRDTGNPISSTADLTITTKDSSITILDSLAVGGASWQKAPRLTVVNTTNGAVSNETGYIPGAGERVSVKISKSTSTGQTATFYIYEY